eukprot:6205041-Pleurochrysis_carterae.AAC.2
MMTCAFLLRSPSPMRILQGRPIGLRCPSLGACHPIRPADCFVLGYPSRMSDAHRKTATMKSNHITSSMRSA